MVYQCPFVSGTLCQMLYEQVLPFLFSFAVIYALVLKTGIFGDESKKYVRGAAAIVSLVLSFFLITTTPYSLGLGTTFAQLFANVSGTTVTFLVVILGVLVILGLFGIGSEELKNADNWKKFVIPGIIIVFVLWLLGGGAAGYGMYSIYDIVWTVIILGIVLFAVWLVVGGEGKEGAPQQQQQQKQPGEG